MSATDRKDLLFTERVKKKGNQEPLSNTNMLRKIHSCSQKACRGVSKYS